MTTSVTDSRHALPLWRSLALLVLALALAACGSVAPASTSGNQAIELRIGYQRGGVWSLLKAKQTLEQHFGDRVKVMWTLFPSGPPLLEAMNANSIDIGST